MNWPRYTAADDAAIRAGYNREPVAALAARLGRTVGAVRVRAHKLGVCPKRELHALACRRPGFAARVLALHDEEYGSYEIARRVGASYQTVRGVLAAHGRAPWGRRGRHTRAVHARRMRAQLAAGQNIVLARWHDRSPAAAYNLPPLSAQALEIVLLLVAGPLTKRQICEATGRPWLGPKRSLRTHGGMTFTHNLKNLGLVTCTGRGLGKGSGKGVGKEYRYSLTPHCLDLLAAAGKGGAA